MWVDSRKCLDLVGVEARTRVDADPSVIAATPLPKYVKYIRDVVWSRTSGAGLLDKDHACRSEWPAIFVPQHFLYHIGEEEKQSAIRKSRRI